MAKLVTGSQINYTCIAVSSDEYERAICNHRPFVRGYVVEGKYQPAEDEWLLSDDWSLTILSDYPSTYWVILNKPPSEATHIMSDIVDQDFYQILEYDIWQPMVSRPWDLAAVVTMVDVD